jgi:hypothetical protein
MAEIEVDGIKYYDGDFTWDKSLNKFIFGENTKEYFVPIKTAEITLNLTSKVFPVRKVKPEELGIHLGLKYIGLNGCAGEGNHRHVPDKFGPHTWVIGHAHVCPKDPNRGMVCTHEKWLRNDDGTYSEILLHEAAHILAEYNILDVECGYSYDTHQWKWNAETGTAAGRFVDVGHGDAWKAWAIRLGVPPETRISRECDEWIKGMKYE